MAPSGKVGPSRERAAARGKRAAGRDGRAGLRRCARAAFSPLARARHEQQRGRCPAGLFVCIDVAYDVFEREVLAHADAARMPERARHLARRRSLVVLAIFTSAMLIASVAPRLGFGLVCGALLLHLRPEVPGSRP